MKNVKEILGVVLAIAFALGIVWGRITDTDYYLKAFHPEKYWERRVERLSAHKANSFGVQPLAHI